MDRREALRLLAATAGIQYLEGLSLDDLLLLGRRLHARARDGRRDYHVLSAHLGEAVTVAAERIIPRSDTPGATDAGVTLFIDHMLADWYQPTERDVLLSGLAELDSRARTLRAQDFVSLSEADQVALLTAIDGEVAELSAPVRNEHWFAMLKFLTVWGYFTSEVAIRQTLDGVPLPGRYEECAPYRRPRSL